MSDLPTIPYETLRAVDDAHILCANYDGLIGLDEAQKVLDAAWPHLFEIALRHEVEWLRTAHGNSADKGYTAEYRKGFEAAIGWVESHAEHGAPKIGGGVSEESP